MSKGWEVECPICDRGHAKWHDLAQEPLNPVALVEMIEAMPPDLTSFQARTRIIGYILGCTGINHAEMLQVLAEERQAESTVTASSPLTVPQP